MKKRLVCCLAACLLALPAVASAKSVTTTGRGITAAEAENDALRRAVENTLGVLVDSASLVENGALIRDTIYTNSRGFVTDYAVEARRQGADGGWEVTVRAEVDDEPDSKLMSELARLGIIDNALRDPKIAVYIPESHIQYRVPDPAGETAVVKALVAAGFTNVVAASPKLPDGYAAGANLEDMRAAARFLDADIVVMGEAFSEGVGDAAQWLPGRQRSGMQSCRARVEAKMYIARTGQIIAADGAYGSGLDISQAVASKKALAAAGKAMGDYFVGEIMKLGAGSRKGMELVVLSRDFARIRAVQEALGRVRGAQSVRLSRYENGRAVFALHYGGAPQTLFHELLAATEETLSMQSAAYNTLTVAVE